MSCHLYCYQMYTVYICISVRWNCTSEIWHCVIGGFSCNVQCTWDLWKRTPEFYYIMYRGSGWSWTVHGSCWNVLHKLYYIMYRRSGLTVHDSCRNVLLEIVLYYVQVIWLNCTWVLWKRTAETWITIFLTRADLRN